MSSGDANTSCSIATAAPRVATARVMPRTRRAGRPTRIPTTTVSATARTGAHGNGTPSIASLAVANAASPANAYCASEICPR